MLAPPIGMAIAVALAAVAALPLLAKPPAWVCDQYFQWYLHLVGPAQKRHAYRDAWTIWELISSPVDPRQYMRLQLAAAAAMLGLCLWQARRTPPKRLVLIVLACWTSWQLVFGPGTERNTFALIAPLTSWALLVAVVEKRGRWLMGLSYLLTILAAIGGVEDVYSVAQGFASHRHHPVFCMVFVLESREFERTLKRPLPSAAINRRTPNLPCLVLLPILDRLNGFPSCGCKARTWG